MKNFGFPGRHDRNGVVAKFHACDFASEVWLPFDGIVLLQKLGAAVMSVESVGVIASAVERGREGWCDAKRGNASWFTLFSSDMTPTADMSAGIMEIPPDGGTLKPHRHKQAEIYFVFEGAGFLTIEGVGTIITAGMAAFIPGDAEHSLRNDSISLLRIFYVFPTNCFANVVYRFPNQAS